MDKANHEGGRIDRAQANREEGDEIELAEFLEGVRAPRQKAEIARINERIPQLIQALLIIQLKIDTEQDVSLKRELLIELDSVATELLESAAQREKDLPKLVVEAVNVAAMAYTFLRLQAGDFAYINQELLSEAGVSVDYLVAVFRQARQEIYEDKVSPELAHNLVNKWFNSLEDFAGNLDHPKLREKVVRQRIIELGKALEGRWDTIS